MLTIWRSSAAREIWGNNEPTRGTWVSKGPVSSPTLIRTGLARTSAATVNKELAARQQMHSATMVRVATLASTVHAVSRASKAIAEVVASSEAEGAVLALVAEGVGARLACACLGTRAARQ